MAGKIAVPLMKFKALDNFEDGCNVIDEEGEIVKLHKTFRKGSEYTWPVLRKNKLTKLNLIKVIN